MRTLLTVGLFISGSCSRFLLAAPQDSGPKGNFVQQLQATYVQTVVAADELRVTQAGSVLAVQVDGIGASPATGAIRIAPFYENSYKDGRIKQGMKSSIVLKRVSRDLAAGEKVYLTKMEVKGDAVVFYILTCGACDPSAVDPSHVPFKASIALEFAKGSLATATFHQIQPIIGQVFTIDTPTTTEDPPPPPVAGQPSPDKFDQVPPPPPPPADPVQIGLGQTTEQIVAALGQPETVVNAGNGKEIYVYKALKMTFVNGKVADIQ
jgi:hypothetical protein